jgi:adenosylmethionine-8-amino-7-oxononanoate aminotransferase
MTLSERDQNTFGIRTQHKTAALPIAIKGARRAGTKTTEYIDAIASWWVNPMGTVNILPMRFTSN